MQLRQQKYPFGSLRKDPHWSVTGLVFCSQFKPAGKLIDESLYGNHGTIVGPTWQGDGLLFSSSITDAAIIPHSDSLNITGELTILVEQLLNGSGDQTLVAKEGKNQYWFEFFGLKLRFFTGGTEYTSTDDVVTDGERSTVGVAYTDSGDFFHFIKNGRIIETVTPVATMVSSTDDVYIGVDARDGTGSDWEGLMYDIKIYNRLLSASEIQQLYINPDLPFQQYPAWWGQVPAAPSGIVPIIQAHTRRRRAG